jgi:trimethylamine--corrinoid protein Co-methyltransferase
MMRGIQVNEDTLALEGIAAVGPGGNFLAQRHTRQHMRDLFLPEFLDRRTYNEWEIKKDNAPNWALEKARKIRASHQPTPLDPSLSRELDRVIEKTQ